MKNKSTIKLILLTGISLILIPTHKVFAQIEYQNEYKNEYIESKILPYFRIDFGKAKLLNTQGSSIAIKNRNLTSEINTTTAAGIGLGINLGDKLRSDINWIHHLHPILRASENGNKVKREPNIEAYFFNLYYEIGSKISVFNPYIGGGVGLSRVSDKLSTSIIEDKSIERASQQISTKNNFAYKFIFGSSFDLSESAKFDLEYNYHDYGRTKPALDSKENQIGKTHYRSNGISFGLRFGA
jgi:opacity protein-like surface antigen